MGHKKAKKRNTIHIYNPNHILPNNNYTDINIWNAQNIQGENEVRDEGMLGLEFHSTEQEMGEGRAHEESREMLNEYFMQPERMVQPDGTGVADAHNIEVENEAGNFLSIGVNDNHEARNRAEGLNSQRVNTRTTASTSLERFFLISNFIVEIPSAVFDQLSSVHKPQYALFSMLISCTVTLISIVALIRAGQKERVTWKWRPIPWFYDTDLKPFGTFPDIIGFTCAVFQCVFTTIAYAFLSHRAENPINMSVWPIIFAFGLLWSRF